MAAARHKIIVGLDYGTTYLGISYVTSNEKSFDKIEVINQWPGTPESVFKVPTRIAYAFENENLTTNQWGYTATPNMEPYLWTKLLLDRNTKLTDYDDPTLDDLLGKGIMRLPESKSAREVCSNFLKCLCEHMVAVLTKKYSSRIFDITPVEVWITLPAIWSDAARDATKSAAMSAGFASRPFDSVNIITEPEAAALAALKPHIMKAHSTQSHLETISSSVIVAVAPST